MTSIPHADTAPPGPAPLREIPPSRRPIPRFVLFGAATLVIFGLIYGSHMRRLQRDTATLTPAFRPYDVVVKSGPQNDPAPIATRSVDDLRRWQATLPKRSAPDDVSTADAPARVHLYSSRRIVLVPAGTSGRVLLEQGVWRRIQILDGLYRGTTGYISRDFVDRTGAFSPQPPATQTAAR